MSASLGMGDNCGAGGGTSGGAGLDGSGGLGMHGGSAGRSGAGRPAARRREAIEVAEPRRPDRQLDGVIRVRQQRQQRLERERGAALRQWRAARAALAEVRHALREQRRAAADCWTTARADFFSMRSNSLEFRAAKASYQRLLQQAEQGLLAWRQHRAAAQHAGAAFFSARRDAALARLKQEKLQLLREEMARALQRDDD